MKTYPLKSILLFISASVIYLIGAATRTGVPGMVFDLIRRDLEFTASQTAMISSCGIAGCMIFISFCGFLIDRFSWRKMILAGAFLQIAGEYFIYSSSSAFLIFTGAFLNGGGRTIGYLTLLKLLDSEFEKRFFSVLIGIFYIFSYGGTFLGTMPFAELAERFSWQKILAYANHLTTGCGILIFFLLLFRRNKERVSQKRHALPDWKEFLKKIWNFQTLSVFFCTASGIMIYWSILASLQRNT